MSKLLKSYKAWSSSRLGASIWMVVLFALAYVLASKAIDTGSWWQYLGAVVMLAGGVKSLVYVVKGNGK